MKYENFANGDAKTEIFMWAFNFLIAGLASLTVFFSDYSAFTMAVFVVVFLLQRIHDMLLNDR